MINSIHLNSARAASLLPVSQKSAKKAESTPDSTTATVGTEKPAHPVQPKGHVPPGLARAAENIASKIFARADVDASGTVTQEELSAIHSKHARVLAASDLFQTAAELPSDPAVATVTEPATTSEATDVVATESTEPEANTPPPTGVTESQLKAALAKYFYAKVGVTWTPPAPTAPEQPTLEDPTDPVPVAETEVPEPPLPDTATLAEEKVTDPSLNAVA